jgi:hypothetical protein
MSINSLTDVEVRRINRQRNTAAGLEAVGAEDGGNAPANNALSMLVKYIPTESITLYVAAASASGALKNFSPKLTEESIYWFFGALTPVLFALIFIGKLRASGLWPLTSLKDWPWWKTFAATVAFLVWALAVPGPPDIRGDVSGAVAGFLAIFISTLLSILEPIFDRPARA